MIKKYLVLIFIFLSSFMAAQKDKSDRFFQFEYTHYHFISAGLNQPKEATPIYDESFPNDFVLIGYKDDAETGGFNFELATYHGFFFTKYTSLAVGYGLNWNINKTYLINPVFFDLRWYLGAFGYNSPYVFIQPGVNINWNNNFVQGTNGKIGLGYSFESNSENFQYQIQIFRKSAENIFPNPEYKDNSTPLTNIHKIDSFCIGFGIKF